MSSDSIIQVDNISFAYRSDQWILRNLSFSISQGSICGLVGPSGSGKTTLGYILKGLIPHAIKGTLEGEILIAGMNVKKTSLPTLAKKVGMVFQDLNTQLFSMTVHEEIEFGLQNLKLPIEWAQEAMNFLGIENLANEIPMNLSAGQKQRVIIASIIAMHPQVLILDEPSAHLDYQNKLQLKECLGHLNAESQTAIILIEQDPWLVGELCNHFFYLKDHQISECSKSDLIEQRLEWSWKW